MQKLDIVELIESNPITKLSSDYNVKLLTKIKESFSDFEQQLFLTSFYCYLKYHPTNDFVIDLDDVWKWVGFSQKIRAKELLEKQFVIDKDYKCLLSFGGKQTTYTNSLNTQSGEQKKGRGGHNLQKFILNITPLDISNADFLRQKIVSVKSTVGISPTIVLLFPLLFYQKW